MTVVKNKWRAAGFTQKRPSEPGVYFVRTDGHITLSPQRRQLERWDIADVYYFAGSYTNAYENREEHAHWRIHSLTGLDYAWRPGMWIKGPITPFGQTQDSGGIGDGEQSNGVPARRPDDQSQVDQSPRADSGSHP